MSTPTTICRSNFKVRPWSLASAGNLADAISSTLVLGHQAREQLLLLLGLGFRQRQLPFAVPRWKRASQSQLVISTCSQLQTQGYPGCCMGRVVAVASWADGDMVSQGACGPAAARLRQFCIHMQFCASTAITLISESVVSKSTIRRFFCEPTGPDH